MLVFRFTYDEQGIGDRLPIGVRTFDETFHGSSRDPDTHKMHSSSIFTYGLEFLGDISRARDDAVLYRHTDYIIQVYSDKLFPPSRRNNDGKFYSTFLLPCFIFIQIFILILLAFRPTNILKTYSFLGMFIKADSTDNFLIPGFVDHRLFGFYRVSYLLFHFFIQTSIYLFSLFNFAVFSLL